MSGMKVLSCGLLALFAAGSVTFGTGVASAAQNSSESSSAPVSQVQEALDFLESLINPTDTTDIPETTATTDIPEYITDPTAPTPGGCVDLREITGENAPS